MSLPPWLPALSSFDSWQTSAWERIAPWEMKGVPTALRPEEHF
jgi:hypothetical protein